MLGIALAGILAAGWDIGRRKKLVWCGSLFSRVLRQLLPAPAGARRRAEARETGEKQGDRVTTAAVEFVTGETISLPSELLEEDVITDRHALPSVRLFNGEAFPFGATSEMDLIDPMLAALRIVGIRGCWRDRP